MDNNFLFSLHCPPMCMCSLLPRCRYTSDCPNLSPAVSTTINVNTPLNQLGGEHFVNSNSKKGKAEVVCKMAAGVGQHYEHKFCAYLCYAHPSYGVAVVPKSLCK